VGQRVSQSPNDKQELAAESNAKSVMEILMAV